MSPLDTLVGSSPSMLALRAQVERLLARPGTAGRLPPILLLGDTGTGKSLLVRVLHQASARRDMPLVDINCAAIPENLLEAELFGFERGAFTDARQGKPGLFQAAHRGLLFLDEVTMLPKAAQAKLLTALEERRVRRLGSTRAEPVDVWVVSATNEHLTEAVEAGAFRLDLYHRLAAITLRLPAVRERGRDVLALARHYLDRAAADYGLPRRELTPDAEDALLAYRWPGNVREVAHVMERAMLLSAGEPISAALIDLPVPRPAPAAASAPRAPDEPARVQEALAAAQGNLSRAAAILGVPRNTLRYRMKRLGVASGAPPEPPEPEAAPPAAEVRLRWEQRWVVGLCVALEPPPGAGPFRLTGLLDDVIQKVERFGGRVEDLHPLGLTALFGLDPVEEAPVHAALAAQAVRATVEGAPAVDDGRAAVRLALHAVHGLVARGAGAGALATGDRARLREALASLSAESVGRIAVGGDAARLLDRRFGLEPTGAGAASAFRLLGARPSAFDWPGGAPSPFFGREREIAQLDDLLADVERGRGQIVGLVGEPGVGKSRLLHEFREGLDPDRVTCLEGRGTPHGAPTPYGPIAQLLRQAFRFAESDDAAHVRRMVQAGVDELGLEAPSPVPYLLHMLGVRDGATEGELAHLAPPAVRQRTLDALRRTVIAASQRRPVVLAIEDLQWIDATSSESLTALAESAAASRILVVTTYRQGHRPPWLGRSYASQLAVRRLGPEDSARIVAAIAPAGAVPPPVASALVERADGVPFFLEELVRAVRERPGEAVIPATIQGVITARLDRVPPGDREVLEAAAVLGREGSIAVLREIAPADDAGLTSSLARLRAAEFLGERRAAPHDEYAFTHVLTHEVTYQGLAAERRRALHGAAAAAIGRLTPGAADRAPEVLAYHLTEAGDVAAAIEQWERAGRLAIERSANAEAVLHLTRALELIGGQPDDASRAAREVAVRLALAAALSATRGYAAPEVGDCLERARALVETLPESAAAFALRWSLWRFFLSRADLRAAEALADRLVAGAEPYAAVAGAFTARVASGVTRFYLGAFAAARARLVEALGHEEAARAPQHIAMYGQDMRVAARAFLAWTRAIAGELDAAAREADDAVAAARDLGHPFSLALALFGAGEVHQLRRAPAAVDAAGQALLDLSRAHGFAFFTAFGLMFTGWARAASGAADGLGTLREGAESFRAVGQRLGLAHRAHLAEALIEGGAAGEARGVVDEALAQADATGEGAFAAELYRLRAAVRDRAGDAAGAATDLRRALDLAVEQGAWLFALRAAADLARRADATASDREALRAAAERVAAAGGDSPEVARAQALAHGGPR